jgi:hypothetical protein
MGRLRSLQADISLELGRAAESGRAIHEIKHDGDRRARGGETAICDGTGLASSTSCLFEGNGVIGSKVTLAQSGSELISAITLWHESLGRLTRCRLCDHQKRSPEPRISIA